MDWNINSIFLHARLPNNESKIYRVITLPTRGDSAPTRNKTLRNMYREFIQYFVNLITVLFRSIVNDTHLAIGPHVLDSIILSIYFLTVKGSM